MHATPLNARCRGLACQTQAPWKQIKVGDEGRRRAGTAVGLALQLCHLLATMLFPYMPRRVHAALHARSASSRDRQPDHGRGGP